MRLESRKILLREFHPGQQEAWDSMTRFSVLRCGRRWGKTELLGSAAVCAATVGKLVGWFAPDYKRLAPSYSWVEQALLPIKRHSNRSTGLFETLVPCPDDPFRYGSVEFWTLGDENAGRSRHYHLVVIDEAAFAGPMMMEIWRSSIKPTLLDFRGEVLVASNTNGIDEDQFFWKICNEGSHRFGVVNADGKRGFHAPSSGNPYLPADDLEDLRKSEHPLVFQQEYLAEFVDWSGVAFFELGRLLGPENRPPELPKSCDAVFSVVDTAVKTGGEHDGTAVVHFALTTIGPVPLLYVLDWDIKQIEGALLETWLPTVFQVQEDLARTCGARRGAVGTWIEDKSSGMVLIQQAARRGWPAQAIDSKLTSVGKDERAISVSGYVYRGQVKVTKRAYEKVVVYKGTSKNHLVAQVVGFRVGDKAAAKRADDLLDDFCYGIALALGDAGGF